MHHTFDTAFHKILIATGDRTWHKVFVQDWVVKITVYYLRNEQLNPPQNCVFYLKSEVL